MATIVIYPSGGVNNAATATGTITCVPKVQINNGEKVILSSQQGGISNFIFKIDSLFVPTFPPPGEINAIVDCSNAATITAADVATKLRDAIHNYLSVGAFG